jgi:hypothetical protein
MKLKRFNEFIAINESIEEFDIEEQLFMIDGEIYEVSQIDMDLTWEHEPADPEVGIFGSSDYVDHYEIRQVTGAMKIVNSELRDEIIDLLNPPSDAISTELEDFGFREEASGDLIADLAFTGDWQQNWKELTGEELKAFSKRFIDLYEANQLKQLMGDFESVLRERINDAEADYDGSPDYDDYYDDDRY